MTNPRLNEVLFIKLYGLLNDKEKLQLQGNINVRNCRMHGILSSGVRLIYHFLKTIVKDRFLFRFSIVFKNDRFVFNFSSSFS